MVLSCKTIPFARRKHTYRFTAEYQIVSDIKGDGWKRGEMRTKRMLAPSARMGEQGGPLST